MKTAASRRGGIISGLLFAGFFVVLAMMVAGVVVTRTVRVSHTESVDGEGVAIQLPGGRLKISGHDHMNPDVAGVPIYPGAYRTSNNSGGANIEWSSADGTGNGLSVVGGEFRTKDSAEDVVEFYRKQLPNVLIVSKMDRGTELEYRKGGVRRIISIHEKNGETRIGVAAIGGRESN